jgi:hypothetical protein
MLALAMRPLRLALACSLLSAAAACNAIFGIQPGMETSASSSGSGSGGGTGGASTSSTGATGTASSAASTTGSTTSSAGSGGSGSGGAPACPAAKIPACHADGGVGAVCDPVLLTPAPYDGYAIGLTVVGSTVYWASGNGKITFGPDQGGVNPSPFGTGEDSVSVATDGQHIYWTDYNDGVIRGATLDAAHTLADVVSVISDAGSPPSARMSRIALQGGTLYWAGEHPSAVWAASADGSQPYPTLVADKVDDVESAEVSIGVAADATHVYWTDAGKVLRLSVGKLGDAAAIESFATNAGAGEVALDADRVYWTSDAGVSSMHRDGTGLITLPSTGAERARSLLLDGDHVYWTTAAGRILRADKGGGMSTVIVVTQSAPEAFMLAADCGAIYWSTFAFDHGYVYKIQKPL